MNPMGTGAGVNIGQVGGGMGMGMGMGNVNGTGMPDGSNNMGGGMGMGMGTLGGGNQAMQGQQRFNPAMSAPGSYGYPQPLGQQPMMTTPAGFPTNGQGLGSLTPAQIQSLLGNNPSAMSAMNHSNPSTIQQSNPPQPQHQHQQAPHHQGTHAQMSNPYAGMDMGSLTPMQIQQLNAARIQSAMGGTNPNPYHTAISPGAGLINPAMNQVHMPPVNPAMTTAGLNRARSSSAATNSTPAGEGQPSVQVGAAGGMGSAVPGGSSMNGTGPPRPRTSTSPTKIMEPQGGPSNVDGDRPNTSGGPSSSANKDDEPKAPYKLPVNQYFTRTSVLSPGLRLPRISEREQKKIVGWVGKDVAYEQILLKERKRVKGWLGEVSAELQNEGDWLGDAKTQLAEPHRRFKGIRFPEEMKQDKARGKRGARPWIEISKKEMKKAAEYDELLCPIRLDLEHESIKLRDTFTWNIKGKVPLTPEIFAQTLCADLSLPVQHFFHNIVSSVKEQLEDFRMREEYDGHRHLPTAAVKRKAEDGSQEDQHGESHDEKEDEEDEEIQWWAKWRRKRMKVEHDDTVAKDGVMEVDSEEETDFLKVIPPSEVRDHTELRIMIKLDITLDLMNLVDQFEWDISDPNNSPERFAEVYASELGLPGEFKTAIAHSVREQIESYVKSLCLIGHTHGSAISEDELRLAFLPPVNEPFRYNPSDFEPKIDPLTPEELDRNDKEREREARRKRRQTKGRQRVQLPDRDPIKTHRTLVPRPNSVLPLPYENASGILVIPELPVAKPFPIVEPERGPRPADLFPSAQKKSEKHAAVPKIIEPLTTTQAPTPGPSRGMRRGRGRPPIGSSLGRTSRAAATSHLAASSGTPTSVSGITGTATPVESTAAEVTQDAQPAPTEDSDKLAADDTAVDDSAQEPGEIVETPPTQAQPTDSAPSSSKHGKGQKLSKLAKAEAQALAVRPQHECFIDGKWHCTNCGVPDGIAVGRRKGPVGPNTLCGACGIYWHRFRKGREIEYTTDPEVHLRLKLEAETRKAEQAEAEKAVRAAQQAARRAANSSSNTSPRQTSPTRTQPKVEASPLLSSRGPSPEPPMSPGTESSRPATSKLEGSTETDKDDNAGSADPSLRLGSAESTVRGGSAGGGGSHRHGSSLGSPNRGASEPSAIHAVASSGPNTDQGKTSSVQGGAQASPPKSSEPKPKPPEWMLAAAAELRRQRPDDLFDIIMKPAPAGVTAPGPAEWRLKCLDCPGKIYTPGPGSTLDNFGVHLKNRLHRQHVDQRIGGGGGGSGLNSSTGGAVGHGSNVGR